MAEKIKKRIINLLPNKGDNVLNQFLSWALTVGRLLVIITETLALSVFIYRFSIDMQLVDLHDKIKNDSIIMDSFSRDEKTYRNLLARLANVHDFDKESSDTLSIMSDVVDLGKGFVTFQTIIVSKSTLELDVQAPSASLIVAFTNKLKNYSGITNLSVDRVENKTSSAEVTVGITAGLKNAKPSGDNLDASDQGGL